MASLVFFLVAASLLSALDASVVRRQTNECPDDCKNKPMEISFVIDNSASIYRLNFTDGLWFVQNFVDKFDIGQDKVRVSLVTYANRVYSESAFGFGDHSDKGDLNNAIDATPYEGGDRTETGMAIDYFLDNQLPQARPGVRHVLIVLTDGNSQEPEITKAAARRVQDAGIETFAIGVGMEVSQQELHNIASDGPHVIPVTSYSTLDDIMSHLVYQTCDVEPVPSCQFNPVDIAFVIDSSVSIWEGNFTLGLMFVKEFLEQFTINPNSIRVAAVMFSEGVHSELAIPFDMYKTKKDTQDAILNLPWMHGTSTKTGLGIDYMVDYFSPHFRPHAAHLGIVITDGQSQNKKKTKESAQRARDAGITMMAVGIGNLEKSLSRQELEDIAGDPARVLHAESYRQLNTIKAPLTDQTCVEINKMIQEQRMVFSQPFVPQ